MVAITVFFFYTQVIPTSLDENPAEHERTPAYTRLYEQYTSRLQQTVTHDRLLGVIAENKDYKLQYPFPHGKSEGLFPQDVLDAINLEIPDDPVTFSTSKKSGCVKGATNCYSEKSQLFKNAVDDERLFGTNRFV